MPQTTPYFVYTPNPFVCDGQTIIPCDLKHGESLEAFLLRHVPHLTTNGWAVSIGGVEVPTDMWGKTFPKPGMHIACRAVMAKQVVQLVAIVALTYFTFGFGAATSSLWGAGAALKGLGALGAIGVYMAGSILINKVLGPKVPKFGETPAAKQVYSLSSQRNSARAYEPIGTLWGEMRVTPDLASQPYTWYVSDDQYLSTILLGGVNVHSVSDLSIGDTPISSFQDVDVYYNGFSGMSNQSIPLSSNTDSTPGGEIPTDQTWVTRTSSVGAVSLSVDMEYTLYSQGSAGLRMAGSEITIQYRAAGTSDAWKAFMPPAVLRNKTTEIKRKSWSLKVPEGQYEVRVKQKILPRSNSSESDGTRNFIWASLRSNQADKTDYSQFGRIGVRIRATGQISGSLDTVRATYRAKPMPVWTGTAWATATTRENGLSNPGAIILQTLRGVKHKGRLQFGFGLADEDIDIEGLKAFMLHCAANGYTYDRWVTSEISLMEFCDEVARAGMGEFSWTDGSRPTAMFVAPGQPTSAVVNMANMAKASFSVDYAVASTADGIEYQYVDRARNFETSTIRVNAPGVTTPLNPARITGEGVTTEAHAAKMARFHLGQSLYQYKTINFGANIEHLDYRRLSVLSVSHDLTQWGFGGRVQEVVVGQGFINVRLDEPVPPLTTRKLGLRLPGERDYRVWDVTPFEGNQEVLTLVGSWPAGERVPGDGDDNPAYDTLWCYDFKATPGYLVRVVNMEPEANLKGATITCVPEGPEFWDYVLNGIYVPAPNKSALPQLERPSVQNVRVTEQTNIQGNTHWWQLNAVWDAQGAAEYCQVWAGLDGSELALVDARATGNRSTWRIEEPGEYLIQVRPFDAAGRAGDLVSVVYVSIGVDIPPVNVGTFTVQEVAGGLRRFAWAFSGDAPAAFAGVKIRYIAGEQTVSAQTWEDLAPLGDVDDTYTAQFETTKPPAGLYTFAIRTINTSGRLSTGVRYTSLTLSDSFEQVQQPDLTPPPEPTGFEGFVGLSVATLYTDLPTYTVGHGHKTTKFYYAQVVQGQPLPTFSSATLAAETPGTHATATVEVGKTYLFWATWTSNDGIESPHTATPVTIAAGKVGDSDLADDLDLAARLADGSISGTKLAAASLDSTKFAQSIQPVTIWTGSSLPTTKRTDNLTWNSKLYTWNGTAYVLPPAGELADGSVTAQKIAAGAVDAAKIAAGVELVKIWTGGTLPTTSQGSVLSWNGKLYRWDGTKYSAEVPTTDLTGQIDSTKLADNAVTVAKIASGAVEAGKLATNAVTSDKIAAGAVGVAKFASGLEPVTLVTGASLPTTKSTTVITWNGKLYRWDGTKYSAEVPTTDLTGQIDATKLADNAVTVAKIASGAVEAGKLATNAVTSDKIAAGAVGVAKFASGIEPVTVVSGSTLPTVKTTETITFQGKLYRWSGTAYTAAVDTTDLTGQITATQITDNAITTPKLAAGSVVAGKIAANAVTANEIAANSVTTAKIQAGAVTATEIAAGAVTASKVVVSDVSTLVPDADYGDSAMWFGGQGGTVSIVATTNPEYNTTASRALQLNRTQSANDWDAGYSSAFPIQSATGYRVRSSVYLPAAGRFLLRMTTYATDNSSAGYREVSVTATGAGFQFVEFTYTTAANAAFARIFLYIHETSAATYARLGKVYVQERTTSSLIVDGAITAAKIAAKTITAGEIAAGTITATELGANAVTAGKIAAGTVTANELATNSVTAVKVAAGAITAGKIAANAVTANEIAAKSVTTAKIAAGAVTAAEVAAGAITASKLRVGDTTNLVADPAWNDTAAWGSGSSNYSFEAGEAADNAARCARYTAADKTGTAGGYAGEMVAAYVPVEQGRTLALSIRIRDYLTAAGVLQLGIVTKKADGTTYTANRDTYTLGTVNGYSVRTVTYAVAADDLSVSLRIRHQYSAEGTFKGPHKILEPTMRVMQSGELIVDGAITTQKLDALAVTAAKLAANSVTAGAIAANAVTAGKIAADAVTAGTIAAGAVSADQIAANAITASKLVVADRSNMLSDTEFKDLVYWYTNMVTSTDAEAVAAINTSPVLANVAGTTANDELYNRSKEYFLSVEPGKAYRVSIDVYIAAGWNGRGQLNLQGYTSNGSTVTTSGNAYTADYRTTPAASATTVSLAFDYTATSTTAFVRFRFLASYTNAAVAGLFIGNPRVRLKQDATLIVDGAITATKLAANSIAVGTAAIQAGAIVNAHIGNLSADKVNAGTLNAARIGAGSIDVTKLAANSVTATQLAANAVTADKIAASAVTAAKMSVTSLSSVSADIGTVTAGRLQNANNTQFLNLSASGTQQFMKAGGLEILANGTSTWAGTLNVKSAASGARLEIAGSQICVYDANNVLRVRLGVW